MKKKRLSPCLGALLCAFLWGAQALKSQSGPPIDQQQNSINGTVTDALGPIPGVHILIKGHNSGTFSDQDGNYQLMAAPSDTLIFTYLGYKTVELAVGNHTQINVQLKEDVTALQEVEVNAGYYTVKERERTGNISKVTAEEIELQPIVSPLEALQGRMAGVEVVQQSGVPGNAPIIRIRGQNSLRTEGNYPLYIIDGVPINSAPIEEYQNIFQNGWDPLSTLNLSNIESIEVLKDADATAIYGSRGANGVVLITTKRGAGLDRKTEVEARWYSGFGQVGRKIKILNTSQYLNMREAALANAGRVPTEENDWDLLLWDRNRYTDWPEKLLGGTSSITDVNVSSSGGNTNTSFRLGGSYHKEGTVFPIDNNYHKVTTAFNLNHTSENQKLGINLSVNLGVDKSVASGVSALVQSAYELPPNAPPLFNEDGSMHWEGWAYSGVYDHPLAGQNSISDGRATNLFANLGLSYKLSKGLSFRTNLGYTFNIRENKINTPNSILPPQEREDVQHSAARNYQKRLSWVIEPQLNYHAKFGNGTIDALIGTTLQQNESDGFGIRGEGYVSETLIGYMPAAEIYTSYGDGRNVQYNYNALYGRVGYNWQKKYFFNLTGRRDGSSRFGPDNRFTNFWAVGTAWIFTEEPIIKVHIPFLSFGKLRGSYGTTGNDQIGDYGYFDAYEATPGPGGLYPTQLFNSDYAWEENKKLEASVELGFIEDRITVGASWYRNRSSNQLVGFPLPAITGFTSIQANLPATVENSGWEIELSTHNIRTEDFRWQTFFNLSLPQNKLLNFPNIDQTAYANIYREGYALNIFLAYEHDGIDPDTGLDRVVDVNADGSYDHQDRTVIKDLGRSCFGGVTNNLSYKGIHFSFLWEFVKQDALRSFIFSNAPGDPYNRSHTDYNAWQNGDLYFENSLAAKTAYNLAQQSDRSIVDASFLRLRTLSLSYDIPSFLLRSIGASNLRIFCAGQNLLTISPYEGINPDNPSGMTVPPLRTITTGLQLNF